MRTFSMPDVGLFTATEPLSKGYKVIIKYCIEVDGLAVYSETYDVAKIAEELDEDEAKVIELWARRIKCAVSCRHNLASARLSLAAWRMASLAIAATATACL